MKRNALHSLLGGELCAEAVDAKHNLSMWEIHVLVEEKQTCTPAILVTCVHVHAVGILYQLEECILVDCQIVT